MILQLVKYGVVGVVNTAITILVIAVLTYLNFNPYFSNAIGFFVGLLNSFVLNSKYTFKERITRSNGFKFFLAFLISYSLNIAVLHILISVEFSSVLVAQVIAMTSYNMAFFIVMKVWVFTYDKR